ncbi:hypothetical protein [Methanoregula boonei]|nr:hypothetical protein [Methanoregula boonei]
MKVKTLHEIHDEGMNALLRTLGSRCTSTFRLHPFWRVCLMYHSRPLS